MTNSNTGWGGSSFASSSPAYLAGNTPNIEFSPLVQMINFLSQQAVSMIAQIRSQQSSMSIADMFSLQMAMNKLSQFSEMSTDIVSAVNTSALSMARNIKS
jgi:hypothetical protein